MKVFKREFSEELTKGMNDGECIITKINDSQYGNFVVFKKGGNDFTYLGNFPGLSEACLFAKNLEEQVMYEYYTQFQKEPKDGYVKNQMEVMGILGWELCGIDSSDKNEKGESKFFYKRILQKNTKIEEQIVNPTQKELRDSIPPKVCPIKLLSKTDKEIKYQIHFGKNGLGLTSELILIGRQIEEFSESGLVYIESCDIDLLDDVYSFNIIVDLFDKQ